MIYIMEELVSDLKSRVILKNIITKHKIEFICSNISAYNFLCASCKKGSKFISTNDLVNDYGEKFPDYPSENKPKNMSYEDYYKSNLYLKYRAKELIAQANEKIWELKMVNKYQKDNIIITNNYGIGEPISQPDCYIRKLNIFQVLYYRFIKRW